MYYRVCHRKLRKGECYKRDCPFMHIDNCPNIIASGFCLNRNCSHQHATWTPFMHKHFNKAKDAVRNDFMERIDWYRDNRARAEKKVAALQNQLQVERVQLQAEKARLETDLHLALVANQRLRMQFQHFHKSRNAWWPAGQCPYNRSPAVGRRPHDLAQGRQLPLPVQPGGPLQH